MRPIALGAHHGSRNPDFGQRTARSRRSRPAITVTFGHPAVRRRQFRTTRYLPVTVRFSVLHQVPGPPPRPGPGAAVAPHRREGPAAAGSPCAGRRGTRTPPRAVVRPLPLAFV